MYFGLLVIMYRYITSLITYMLCKCLINCILLFNYSDIFNSKHDEIFTRKWRLFD